MTKRLLSFFAVFVFAVTMTVSAAEARISIGADLVQRLEATETDGTPASASFQEPAANLHIYGDVASNVEAYLEVQTLPDVGVAFTPSVSATDEVTLRQAYLTLTDLGPVELKVGNFEVDFGNRHLDRSDNAQVQDNPLIGNDLLDPVARQSGLEVSGEVAGGNMGWALGITNGTDGTNFADGGGFALIPKVWGNFGPGLSTALSYYTVDQSDATAPGGGDNLFTFTATNTGIYDVLNDPYQGYATVGSGPAPASLDSVGGGAAGQDLAAWQLDFGWEGQMGEVNAWWGNVEDDGPATTVELAHYGVEGAFNFTPNAYGAARYSVATDESSGAPAADQSDRLQVGMGYNLNENTLAKFEWVDQTNESPTSGFAAASGDADGFIAEISASF